METISGSGHVFWDFAPVHSGFVCSGAPLDIYSPRCPSGAPLVTSGSVVASGPPPSHSPWPPRWARAVVFGLLAPGACAEIVTRQAEPHIELPGIVRALDLD